MAQAVQDEDGTVRPAVVLRAVEAYDGRSSMIGQARQFVSGFLQEVERHGAEVGARVVQDAQLVVSELVTNVHRHAPGRCTLALEWDASVVRIAVSDTREQAPEPAPRNPGRVGGHGLEIVLALCERVETLRTASGKTIIACLPWA
ncbi:ATP-binding protein [Streptomyces sp. V4-01]|uniref:ATP-binding protein n=1 Tax=Actinacidiphila polyblastidii TaxID=3110430 RepID=A0ABU7P3P2_9ACTN|nr:ATP-binding protein [Streptomyces sp. V4-01]